MRLVIWGSSVVLAVAWPAAACAQAAGDGGAFTEGVVPDAFATVAIHPPASGVTCSQHAVHAGDPIILGDAAGIDCHVVRYLDGPGGHFPRVYQTDGGANDDWYAWGAEVFAPFDGVVEAIQLNPVTNPPGIRGEPPASYVTFRREDGVRVIYAHIADPGVAPGDSVTAGQVVARIGNNGFSWFPHLHLGAWRGREPVLIVLDPRLAGELEEREFRKTGAR